jgi:hypothetical protein
MAPEVLYTVRLALGGSSEPDITAPNCQVDGGDPYWGGVMLVFEQQ